MFIEVTRLSALLQGTTAGISLLKQTVDNINCFDILPINHSAALQLVFTLNIITDSCVCWAHLTLHPQLKKRG